MDRGVCSEEAHPEEDRIRLILFFFEILHGTLIHTHQENHNFA